MVNLYANPYNPSARGFYFKSTKEFDTKYKANLPVEEYEIELIDGSDFERLLQKRLSKNGFEIPKFFDLIDKHNDEMTDEKLVALEYLFEYQNCNVGEAFDKIDDVMVFEGTPEEYAMDIFYDEIDEKLANMFGRNNGTGAAYFDFKALARDMRINGEIEEIKFNHKTYVVSY